MTWKALRFLFTLPATRTTRVIGNAEGVMALACADLHSPAAPRAGLGQPDLGGHRPVGTRDRGRPRRAAFGGPVGKVAGGMGLSGLAGLLLLIAVEQLKQRWHREGEPPSPARHLTDGPTRPSDEVTSDTSFPARRAACRGTRPWTCRRPCESATATRRRPADRSPGLSSFPPYRCAVGWGDGRNSPTAQTPDSAAPPHPLSNRRYRRSRPPGYDHAPGAWRFHRLTAERDALLAELDHDEPGWHGMTSSPRRSPTSRTGPWVWESPGSFRRSGGSASRKSWTPNSRRRLTGPGFVTPRNTSPTSAGSSTRSSRPATDC